MVRLPQVVFWIFIDVFFWPFGVRAGSAYSWPEASPEHITAVQEEAAVSSDQQSLEKRGDLYMARKYYAEAADTYKKALVSDPKNPLLYNKLGIAHHQLLDYNSAKRSYRKAIQFDPRYAQAINNLAAVEYAQKHYKAAVLTYLKALKLTPGDAVIYSNLGTAYFALERFEYAVTSYRYALSLDPAIFHRGSRTGTIVHQRDEKNSAAFNFYMAKVYAQSRDIENTLLYLEKAWEEGFPDILKAVKDAVFEFLAAEPKFTELLTKIQTTENQDKSEPRPF